MGLGVEEGGLSSLIRSTYKLLGLKTYFTTGEKETKAWTIKDGMTAPQAAGVIHTDFEKGFIRAQTISYQNLIDSGSIANAKTKGLLRSEGKEYVVNEGDVMEFLLNVYLVFYGLLFCFLNLNSKNEINKIKKLPKQLPINPKKWYLSHHHILIVIVVSEDELALLFFNRIFNIF